MTRGRGQRAGGEVSTTNPIRLGVIDDHEAIRIGIIGATQLAATQLEAGQLEAKVKTAPIRVTCQAATVDELIAAGPDACEVVALDLGLADGSSPASNIGRLLGHGCDVIVYSLADDRAVLREALSAGAGGYVRKSERVVRLLEMVRDVHAGRPVICREFAAVVDDDPQFARAELTDKEREAVGLYASGLSVEATAQRMQCTPATAKTYVDRARAKYQAQNRPAGQKVQLFINAIEDGILPPVLPRSRR